MCGGGEEMPGALFGACMSGSRSQGRVNRCCELPFPSHILLSQQVMAGALLWRAPSCSVLTPLYGMTFLHVAILHVLFLEIVRTLTRHTAS